VVSSTIDGLGWTRRRAAWVMGAIIAVLGIPSAWSTNFLGVVDTIANNLFLLGGGLALSIFVGWVMDDPIAEVSVGTSGIRWFGLWRMLLRFVAPALLAIALLEAIPSTWQAIVDLF
jgi:NSS family neurotransmitter:Na+ symporter